MVTLKIVGFACSFLLMIPVMAYLGPRFIDWVDPEPDELDNHQD